LGAARHAGAARRRCSAAWRPSRPRPRKRPPKPPRCRRPRGRPRRWRRRPAPSRPGRQERRAASAARPGLPHHRARLAAAAPSGSASAACRCRRRPAAAREPRRDHRERLSARPARRPRPPPRPPGAPPTPDLPPSDWFWRAITCGQDEAPSCATAAAPREAGANHAPVLDRRRRQPPGDPCPPGREGPPAPGVWGQRPHDPQPWAGSPAEPEWQPSATLHQRCVDMQAIAALTASWGERVFELAPHLTTSLGEMAAKLRAARLSRR